jgi:two-component system response regulator HydG
LEEFMSKVPEEVGGGSKGVRGGRKREPGTTQFMIGEPDPILGLSLEAQSIRDFIKRFASAVAAKILITGPTGSGKDLVARHLHYHSSRRAGPFVAVNCASIAGTLAESELFGHVKGAFTGADRKKRGYFQLADGGTLFLDEIGDLSPAIQAKLLRAIQQSLILPVGAEEPIMVDVRIIAATNQNLEAEVALGHFREDFYERLRTMEFRLPSLKERVADILELAATFLKEAARIHKKNVRKLSDDAARCLLAYSWPRNIRELEHEMERLTLAGDGETVSPNELHARIVSGNSGEHRGCGSNGEAKVILDALHQSEKLIGAAELLGMHRITLWRKMREHGIGKDFLIRPTNDDKGKGGVVSEL